MMQRIRSKNNDMKNNCCKRNRIRNNDVGEIL